MNIVTCTDSKFVIPTGVMLSSVCHNNQGLCLNLYLIIDNSVTERQKEEIECEIGKFPNCTINFFKIDISDIQKYLVVTSPCFPVPVYYRLLMADILPNNIDKVLYLDGDIIVRHNLSNLWNTNIDEVGIGAVLNQSNCAKYWERLNYPEENGYFNSGVLLINLKYWREHSLSKKFLNYIINYPEKLVCQDQDVLNVILKDSRVFLPERYNMQESYFRAKRGRGQLIENEKEIEKYKYDPYIVHYTAGKPWFKENLHPLKNLYYRYKQDTVWKNNNSLESSHISIYNYYKWYLKQIVKKIIRKEKYYIDLKLEK